MCNIKIEFKVDLLLWLDKAMFGSSNCPPLSYYNIDTPNSKFPTANEELLDECERRKSRKAFYLSLNFASEARY